MSDKDSTFSVLGAEDYQLIGRIMLAWGSAESSTGGAVAAALGLEAKQAIREICLSPPFARKLRLLEVALQDKVLHPNLKSRLTELRWAFDLFKPARDVIAHGAEFFDMGAALSGREWEPGISLSARGRFLRTVDLPNQLAGAEHAADAAAGLMLGLLFSDEGKEALPPCPPRPLSPRSLSVLRGSR